MSAPRVGVVGHAEWTTFAPVARVPVPGEIVHAGATFDEAAGGGAVAAVQLARLAGAARFTTALGHDEVGDRVQAELERLGVQVDAVRRPERQRRAFCFVDDAGERTITVIGRRHGPRGEDALDWAAFDALDAVYVTAGDAEAIRQARRARVLVATPRVGPALVEAGVRLDALVHSGADPGEAIPAGLRPPPALVVSTAGAQGGGWTGAEGRTGTWVAAALPGPVRDAYGAGDSFAAGLTFGLATRPDVEGALELAARCGAHCLTGRGPYGGQLRLVGQR